MERKRLNGLFRTVVVLVASFALIACTTVRVVSDGQSASASALGAGTPAVSPREHVVVTTTDEKRHELRVTSIDAQSIVGTADGMLITIPVEQIVRIERSELDSNKVVRAALIYVVVSVFLGVLLGKALGRDVSGK